MIKDYVIRKAIHQGTIKVDAHNGQIWRVFKYRNGAFRNKQLKLQRQKSGHLTYALCLNNRSITCSVHRTVWIYSNGIPSQNLEINHKDSNPANNKIGNLEIVTHKENALHAKTNNRLSYGEHRPASKLTESDVKSIRKEYKWFKVGIVFLAIKYDVHPSTIHRAVTCQTWQHI